MADALLSVRGLTRSFGALKAAQDVSFELQQNELLGVIGPNGAGKTTLLALLSGALSADSGEIIFDGRSMIGLPLFKRARAGLVRTHQIPRPFTHMTVEANLLAAALFGGHRSRAAAAATVESALSLCGLQSVRAQLAGDLPLLLRKRHELARALATGPRLLLVDEVAGGLTDREVDEFVALILEIRSQGIAIIWIEHIMRALTKAADTLIAVDMGRIIARDTPTKVLENPLVREVYLGR